MALEINNTNLEEILKEKELTILDFWAEWCGPCKMLGPVIDELVKDNMNNDKVSIGKVNVDVNGALAVKYGVRGIPTILFVKDGEVIDRIVGFKNKVDLQTRIDELLS